MPQQDFSEWVYSMRMQTQATTASPVSESSSWADTDLDSDSDNESGHFAYFESQGRRSAAKKMVPIVERTAPMMIPQCSRRRRSYYTNEFEESVRSQHAFGADCSNSDSSVFEESVDDEDDPALYQNLAYFRSQSGRDGMHSQKQSVRSRSSSPQAPSVSASDSDDIFDMEL